MLGRTIGAEIERGADPLAGIRPALDRAAAKVVNLECVLSDKGTPDTAKRYSLRAPLNAIRVLTAARIGAVSLAPDGKSIAASCSGVVALLNPAKIAAAPSGFSATHSCASISAAVPYWRVARIGKLISPASLTLSES